MAISENVKVDAAARKAQIQSLIDKKNLEKAEHDSASTRLAAEVTNLESLLTNYNKDIPAPPAQVGP